MLEQVCSEQVVEHYFTRNSPRFDSIEISHIVLDTEGNVRERRLSARFLPEHKCFGFPPTRE